MTEILTESFCERCGTRYTFESARPRVRLKGVKVLSRGLKNFVLSDDTSMDEAMAAARSETDREATAHQLDAFHKTFNFCMSCRQYTCPNCWNEPEVRCLTCAPLALPEEPAVVDDVRAFRDAVLIGELAPVNGTAGHDHDHDQGAWEATTTTEVAAGEAAEAPPLEVELEPTASVTSEAETAVTAEVEAVAPSEVDTVEAATTEPPLAAAEPAAVPVDPAGKAAAQTAGLLKRFRPGQSLDAELDAFERQRGEATVVGDLAAGEQPAIEAPQAQAMPATELEPAAEAAIHEPTPEAAPATVEPAPAETLGGPADVSAPEPEPRPLAAASGADVVEQPTWRITAPDATGVPTPTPPLGGDAGVPLQANASPAAPDAEPQWPARPQWPSTTAAAGLPFLGRPAAPEGGIEALWAASNQELVTAAPTPQGRTASGIQPCISCGLSLSANARFCRRCGTLQSR